MSANKVTLAIVDDHPVVIEGLSNLLKANDEIEITGTFTKGYDFLSFLKQTPVQVVLLDIYLPDINGIDLCREIKIIAPATLVLALSNHEERSAIMKMLENGASGYLLKTSPVDELLACINEALDGKITFSRAVKEIMARPIKKDEFKDPVKLTVREKEILELIAAGTTTPGMAKLLFLSKFTIEGHRKNLLQKFKAKNVAELITMATQQGFL